MCIVHYLDRIRLEDGGVVRAVLDICALLAQHGRAVTLVAVDARDVPKSWSSRPDGAAKNLPHVEVIPPKTFGGFFNRGALARIEEVIGGAKVLHLHTVWDRGNLQFAKIARRLGVPYVVTAHGMLDDWSMAQRALKKRIYHRLVLRNFMRHAAFVHCTAEFEKAQAQKWFPPGKGFVIPLIFDLQPFQTLPGEAPARNAFDALATDEPKILFLSRLHPKKSIEVLIDAVRDLRRDGMPVQLFIAGSGDEEYERALRERTAALGLEECAHFLGLVVGEQKVSLYQACDIFALPTSQENFGFVLVESLAAETPVITTKGVDIWPELEKCGGALIVERDASAFARALRQLIENPSRRAEMGARGRRWVLDYLHPDHVVAEFEKMYAAARESAS